MDTLNLFENPSLNLPLTDLLGESVAVLGIKGSGKSNTAARLSEQLLTAGVPMVIVDIEGEYWGLKERFPLVVAGKSPHVDLELVDPAQAAALATWSLQERMSVILDLSSYRKEQPLEILNAYLEALYEKAGVLRRPYQIILEEAHHWIPQAGKTLVSDILTVIAIRGRKRGLGIVMVGQRSANIDKSVLSQAGILLLHRVRHPADIGVYQDIVPDDRTKTKTIATALKTGEALLVTHDMVCPVQVLPRDTYHAGYTPGMAEVQPPTLTSISGEVLASLKTLLAQDTRQTSAGSPVPQLEATIQGQVARIAVLEAENERLAAENALLAKLRLEASEHVVAQNGVAPQQLAFDLPAGEYRSELATTRARKRQEREFVALLRDIRAQPNIHRFLLKFLLERTNREFSRKELARYLGYVEKTLADRPPLTMISMGLIQRQDSATGYTAKGITTYLQQKFPDLDTDDLLQQLISETYFQP